MPREATGAPLFDVDQIEVLPGPQGTLYGGNAMGGRALHAAAIGGQLRWLPIAVRG